jgi:thioredoxin 1
LNERRSDDIVFINGQSGDGPEPRRSNVAGVQEVTDASFDGEVLKSDVPVLIDLWAPWCGPCKAISPVVEELAKEYSGRLKVVKMNVDDNPQTPSRYGVRSIPNLILFKNGQVRDQIVGAVPKAHLVKAIDQVV